MPEERAFKDLARTFQGQLREMSEAIIGAENLPLSFQQFLRDMLFFQP